MGDRDRKHRLAVAVLRFVRRRGSRILLYHGVGEAKGEEDQHHLLVRPDHFRRHIQLFKRAGFEFVSVAEFVARTPEGGPPPPGLVALSFDDGMEDNYSALLPILTEHEVPATIYVLTGMIGRENPWLPGARMMNRDELYAVSEAGIELAAHTTSHPDMSNLGFEECLREMNESRKAVEEITARQVRTFAYPFGHYGADAMRAAEAAGFDAAVTCANRGSWARFEMKRTLITGRDGTASFVARVCGVYEPLVLGRFGAFARRATSGLRAKLRGWRGT